MTLPLYSEGDDRSRGTLGASSLREDRVGTPPGLSQQGLSQAKLLPALRGILHMWLGPALTLGVLLIFIFIAGRHWHG